MSKPSHGMMYYSIVDINKYFFNLKSSHTVKSDRFFILELECNIPIPEEYIHIHICLFKYDNRVSKRQTLSGILFWAKKCLDSLCYQIFLVS